MDNKQCASCGSGLIVESTRKVYVTAGVVPASAETGKPRILKVLDWVRTGGNPPRETRPTVVARDKGFRKGAAWNMLLGKKEYRVYRKPPGSAVMRRLLGIFSINVCPSCYTQYGPEPACRPPDRRRFAGVWEPVDDREVYASRRRAGIWDPVDP